MKPTPTSFRKRLLGESLEPRHLLAGDVVTGVVSRIVGGQDADDKFGWVASLQDSLGHFCGGTLVSPTAVVAAAHCVDGVDSSSLSVVVGRSDLGQADGQRIRVDRVISHPAYNAFTNDSDIAILRLSTAAQEQPIGLIDDSNALLASPGTESLVLGWGATDEGGPTTTRLQSVRLPIVSNETANEPISYGGDITENMLAAGRASGGIDSCQGDSGGPLVVFDAEERPLLAGVVSWGEGCARPNKYGIYARVSQFASWIGQNAEIESPKGLISFSPSRLLVGSVATISVEDSDLSDRSWIEVPIASESGDMESVRLNSFATGRFRGTVKLTNGAATPDNGIFEVDGIGEIVATYFDADDGTGNPQQSNAVAVVVADDFTNGVQGAIALTAGEPVLGEIDVIGDRDWFRLDFPDDGGFEVRVELDNSTLNDSVLSLFAADGETLLAIDDDGGRGLGSQTSYFSSQARTIYVEVAGYGANIGSYRIVVEETKFENDDHFNVFSLSTMISAGESITGSVNYPADEDWFQFEAEAGILYQANVTLDGLADSQLRLVDQNGRTELSFNDDRTSDDLSSRLFFFVDHSGTYYLEVGGYQDETGTYELTFDESDDDHGNLVTSATDLGAISTEVEFVSGEITEYDEDWFVFSAQAERFYAFETVFPGGRDTLTDTRLRLFDQTGEYLLAANDDHIDRTLSKLIWQAPADGQYVIQVTGYDEAIGTYDLEFWELPTPPIDDFGNIVAAADLLQAPATINGTINYEADFDLFQFDAIEGYTYIFDIELGSLEDSVVRLLAADNQTVLAENDDAASDDLSSIIEWTASESATFFVQAAGFDGHLGSYRLHSAIFGDISEDGKLNATDLDVLAEAIRNHVADPSFDLNLDNRVDKRDLDLMLRDIFHTVRGDADLNGTVDFADFLALSSHFGQVGGWANGDYSGNGTVEFEDFLLLSLNFGITDATNAARDGHSNPSPWDLGLLADILDAKLHHIKNRLYVNPK